MTGPTAHGIVPESHFQNSRFTVFIPSIGTIPVSSLDARPDPTTTFVAKDRTIRSGGETEPQTINMSVPMGNDAQRMKLHAKVEAARGIIAVGYREDFVVTEYAAGGVAIRVETLGGAWLSGREEPGLDKAGDPEDLVEVFQVSYSRLSVSAA